jgi:hypothetical protein
VPPPCRRAPSIGVKEFPFQLLPDRAPLIPWR